MRISLSIILLLCSAGATAEITCEQLGGIAQEAVRQRDQGALLTRLLADVERGELKSRLTAQELALVEDVIRQSFDGTLSPREVYTACREGGTSVPAR